MSRRWWARQSKQIDTEWPTSTRFWKCCREPLNLCATLKESCIRHKQLAAVGFISDSEEIVKASWLNFQHNGAAAFELLERSSVPAAFSAKHLPGEWTQELHMHQIKRINHYTAISDDDSSPGRISDTASCLNWNGRLDNPHDSADDREAESESDIQLDNSREDSYTREQHKIHATPPFPGLIGHMRL